MVDVGNTQDKNPIDFIIFQWVLPIDQEWCYYVWDLTITNYDHDHYSWLPYLRSKAKINSIQSIKSISSDLLNANKPEKTEALNHLIHLKNTYTSDVSNWAPPYTKWTKYLYPTDQWDWDFNNLSQIVFIEYAWFNICIPWDLESAWWNIMLNDPEIQSRLGKTQIFFASHHWRENWYMKEIFDHCQPNLIIISDKEIIHWTQEKSSDVYWKHVNWNWVVFDWQDLPRKVISTRNDWSFVFRWFNDGNLGYSISKINF